MSLSDLSLFEVAVDEDAANVTTRRDNRIS